MDGVDLSDVKQSQKLVVSHVTFILLLLWYSVKTSLKGLENNNNVYPWVKTLKYPKLKKLSIGLNVFLILLKILSLLPCSSSPTEARWSHNSGNNFLLHMVRTSALSRLYEANRNSLLLCLGGSDGGVGGWEWIQCCLRGKSSHLFSDLSVSTWLLLTLCRVKTMMYPWRLLPLIHLTVVRICWWLSRKLKSHYCQVFCSSASLQNISHVSPRYISRSLVAHMHMQRKRLWWWWEMFN